MKNLKSFLTANFVVQIGLSVLIGYVIGLIISYINLFGSSQNAPLMCAMGAGIASLIRTKRKTSENKIIYK